MPEQKSREESFDEFEVKEEMREWFREWDDREGDEQEAPDMSAEFKEHFLQDLQNRRGSTIPLDFYLFFAAEIIAESDNKAKPRLRIFEFTRYARSHPEIAELVAEEALARVKASMENFQWGWTLLEPSADADESEIEFTYHWDRIRFPIGALPLERATSAAIANPFKLRNERNDKYVRFISLAGHLQMLLGDRNILLPCRLLAAPLQCSHETVKRMRDLAKKDGFLREVKRSVYHGSPGTGRATEFRFALDRFSMGLIELDR
jgi:hypothetical protein